MTEGKHPKRSSTSTLRARPLAVNVAALFTASAALFATSPGFAQNHLRLGAPEIHSALGNPLWVKIPLDVANAADEISASRFSLGSRPANAAIPFLEAGEVTFERIGTQYFVVVRSRQSIDEPAIGLVIRELLPNGVRSREFIILLDPPPLTISREARAAATNAQALQSIPAAASNALAAPPLPAANQTVTPAANTSAEPLPAPARSRRSRVPAAPLAAPADEQRSRGRNRTPVAAVESIRPERSIASRPRAAAAPVAPMAAPKGTSRAEARPDKQGPKLSLSLSTEGFSNRPAASEAERTALRERQLLMDVDDLTAALMDRHHKISKLEKELGDLAQRVAAAERFMNSKGANIAPAAIAMPAVVPPAAIAGPAAAQTQPVATVAADSAAVAALPAQKAAIETASPVVIAPKPAIASQPSATDKATDVSWPWWKIAGAGLALLALLAAIAGALRGLMRARANSRLLNAEATEDYAVELAAIAARAATRKPGAVIPATDASVTRPNQFDVKTVEQKSVMPESHPAAATGLPEIHFELPSTPSHLLDSGQAESAATSNFELSTPATVAVAAADAVAPPEDLRSRRMRYLQSRYQDIAILKPALDAPQRLLKQAGTLYDEGAADFAKRLLKYAAYSRPHAEEFWLALLELLYREQFSNDYVVNTKWFRQYHPTSKNWDEVQRIGYLLDAAEPMFASAALWSHDAPAVGVWLPATVSTEKIPASPTHLKLELAN